MSRTPAYKPPADQCHRAVKELFKQIECGYSSRKVAIEAGLGVNTIYKWGAGYDAGVNNLEAALNYVGFKLVAVPEEYDDEY